MHSLARDWGELSGCLVRSGTEPGLRYSEVVYDVGMSQPRHAHASPFFVLTLDGGYWEEVAGKVIECAPQTVVFHPGRIDHAITIVLSTAHCFMLELDEHEIALRYQARLSPALFHTSGGPMASALQDLHDELRLRDDCSPLAIQGLLLQLLAGTSRSAAEIERGSQRTLTQISNLLRDRFRERLTIEDIATEVGVTPARASRIFRAAYRRTIAEEQRRLRIDFARHRMNDPDVSLATIADEAGFADQAHFSRAFKRVTGATPARYRRRIYAVCDPTT